MFKVNNRNTRIRCELCSKLNSIPLGNYMFKVNNRNTTGAFIVNFEYISHLVLVFLLLTLNRWMPAGIRRPLADGFLCPPVVITTTDGIKFIDIAFFLTVDMWKSKTFDFIIFASCKLNIHLNEQILMNISHHWNRFLRFLRKILQKRRLKH